MPFRHRLLATKAAIFAAGSAPALALAASDSAFPAPGAGLPRKFYSLTPRLPDTHCCESVTKWHGFCKLGVASRAVTFNLLFEVRP